MIQNLLNISSRPTEKNVSGTIKDGNEKGLLESKEGLFKQLFEGLQNPGENEESEKKPTADNSELPKETDTDLKNSNPKSDTGKRIVQAAPITDVGEGLNQPNETDIKSVEQAKSASVDGDYNTYSSQKMISDQVTGIKDKVVTESKIGQLSESVTNGQFVQGSKSKEGSLDTPLNVTSQSQNNSTEAATISVATTNGSEKPDAEQTDIESKLNKTRAPALAGQHIQDGTGAIVEVSTNTEANGRQVNQEKTEPISENGVFKTSLKLPKDDVGLGSENVNNVQGSLTNDNMTVKRAPNSNDIMATGQATKTVPEESATLGSGNKNLDDNKLTETENSIRIEYSGAGEENRSGRVVADQSRGTVLSSGPQGLAPQTVEFVKKAQAFVAENGQINEKNEAPVTTLIRDELKTTDVNKPEVFGLSSDIKKAINQKNHDENIRSRLDVDKISMRADTDKRTPVLSLENQPFTSNTQQSLKWGWAAGVQSSSSKNMDDSSAFNTLKPDSTVMKDVEIADQKSTNYTNLTSITISNIFVKRNVLPGLTQAVLNAGTSKSSPESWNKHSFVLEDGSKIQLAARKLEGVIQLKIGSATPELNRLLQQHQSEIIEHLKKETELEVDLQFDNPKEESGFESFDDRSFTTNSSATQGLNSENTGPAGARKYATGKSIRTFGYNNMEWTA